MRVCIVLPGLSLTGGVVVAVNAAQQLARFGHDVVIAHSGWRSEGDWIPGDVRLIGPSTGRRLLRRANMRFGPSTSWLDLSNSWLLAKVLPSADIYIATASSTVLPAVSVAAGRPVVQFMMHDEMLVNADNPVKASIAAGALAIAPHIWTNSTWLARRVEIATGRRPEVVFPAVDHGTFHPKNHVQPRDTSGCLRVVSLIKDIPVKGLTILVEALAEVSGKRDVLWIGFGSSPKGLARPYPCRLEYHASPTGETLASLYQAADIFVSPSLSESFPLPPLEAMACGTPVITTGTGTEDYAQDNVNCLVVPPGDARALAGAITRLIDDTDLADRLRAAGLVTAAKFTWESTGQRAHQLLSDLVGPEGV